MPTEVREKSLDDLARQLVSVAKGQIERAQIQIVKLKQSNEELRRELAKARDPDLTPPSPRCEHCVYKLFYEKHYNGAAKATVLKVKSMVRVVEE